MVEEGPIIGDIIVGALFALYLIGIVLMLLHLLEKLTKSATWASARKEALLFILLPVGCFIAAVLWPWTLTFLFLERYLCVPGFTCCGIDFTALRAKRGHHSAADLEGGGAGSNTITPPAYSGNIEQPAKPKQAAAASTR
jgi:hypothetical protein